MPPRMVDRTVDNDINTLNINSLNSFDVVLSATAGYCWALDQLGRVLSLKGTRGGSATSKSRIRNFAAPAAIEIG